MMDARYSKMLRAELAGRAIGVPVLCPCVVGSTRFRAMLENFELAAVTNDLQGS